MRDACRVNTKRRRFTNLISERGTGQPLLGSLPRQWKKERAILRTGGLLPTWTLIWQQPLLLILFASTANMGKCLLKRTEILLATIFD